MSLLGAIFIPVLFAAGGLAFDINRGVAQRVSDQNLADSVALSAAVAYSQANQNGAVLSPTGQALATVSGLSSSNVNVALVNDYPVAGATAVRADVTVPVPVAIAGAIGFTASYNTTATSFASITAPAPVQPCLLALSNSSSAIAVGGGGTVNAGCDVAAVGTIDNEGAGITARQLVSGSGGVINNWGKLTADQIDYATTFSNPSWNSNIPSSDKIVKQSTTLSDSWAANASLISARALLGTYTAPNATSNPVTPSGGGDWFFSYQPNGQVKSYQTGPYTFVVPAGNYQIQSLDIGDNTQVTFQGPSTITVAGGLTMHGGSKLVLGNVNLSVNGGFSVSGFTMGDGNLSIGSGTVSFSGTNTVGNGTVNINSAVSVSGGASLRMGAGNHAFQSLNISGGSWIKLGAGDLDVDQGLAVGDASTLVAEAGNYRFGADGSGRSISLAGSAVMITGDGQFSTAGSIVTGGGSRLVIGSTANHTINGDLSIAGGVLFGQGAYTVNGNFTNGTGGATWPYTDPISGLTYGSTLQGISTAGYDMAGVNVTFILKGTLNLAGGAKTLLIAPSTTVTGGMIQNLLLDSLTSQPTSWGAGALNTMVGAVHLPNSDVSMTGGSATLGNGQCFMLTANTINISGGATTATTCTSSSSSGAAAVGAIALVG